ncbi:MAG: sulfurtransferase [Geobacteraceae bacterium]|nr:sulfurtransferase [Geobacteraceae bacterium]NTW79109.1 sulfurtransferase [Geobacteraceae bacterium]
MSKKTVVFTMLVSTVFTVAVFAADSAPVVKPNIAKICTSCHKAEADALRGNFDNVAFKSKTIQLKIDDAVELVKFDEDEIKVISGEGKSGDGELLRAIKKGHEIKIEFLEKGGVKTAVKVIEKPPVKVSKEMLMTTADVEKLVAMGPEKGKYFLFDARPLPRYKEGFIPTAVNLPFPAFDKMAEKLLPKDKKALIIFYCAGPACNMSPGSAAKAMKLGYTNLKVYVDGMPAWSEKNYGLLSAQFLKESWIDKDIPHVLLDVRSEKDVAKGFIKGAVAFPAKNSEKLIKALEIKKGAPVMVYDQNGGHDAKLVASALVKAGFKRVVVLNAGFDAWQTLKYDVSSGKLAAKATYTPKPRPGEIDLAEFEKYAANLPANVMIIDVRNQDEGKAGMLKTAKLIPAEEFKERLAELPKDKLLITLCSTGVRAEMAYHALKELGYTNVKFVNAKTDFAKDGSYKTTKD